MTNEQKHILALAGLLYEAKEFVLRAGQSGEALAGIGSKYLSHLKEEENKAVELASYLAGARPVGAKERGDWQLPSIFCRIGEEGDWPDEQFWPLESLNLDEAVIFPGGALTDKETVERAYETLWAGFVEAIQAMSSKDLPTYLEGIYYALQRFAWCVPIGYADSPSVSLFDHGRTTAALAVSLAGLSKDVIKNMLEEGNRQTEPLVLMVEGDLSGVQDFIYTITARGAAKGLRGRSFYLQLLTEAVARFILRELELPITNALSIGGGHFQLLVPYAAKEKLEEVRVKVSRKLLDHHGGDLYLALGWKEFSVQDLVSSSSDREHKDLPGATMRAKRQRFAELDADLLVQKVFGPLGEGGDETGECQVCHYDGPEVKPEREDDEVARQICPLCKSLEELGHHLREADCLLLGEVEPKDGWRGGYTESLKSFGTAIGFTKDDGKVILSFPEKVQRATLLAMHDLSDVGMTAGRIFHTLGCPAAHGTRYTVNVTPRVSAQDVALPEFKRYAKDLPKREVPRAGDVKEFGLMQAQSQGTKRLGVLRMDADDFGSLRQGMKDATLAQQASLGFAISLFFEGWIGELCRRANREAGTDKVYAIYSGGDDLFIVGAWDVLPALANSIRNDLTRFAAGNSAIHISGGLTLHAGKYPLYQAAHDAEEALDAAKDWKRPDDHDKDAFNFLEITIPWEEYGFLRQKQKELARDVTSKKDDGLGIPHALLRTLIRLYEHYTRAVYRDGKPRWGPWMWRSAYFLGRMEGRYRGSSEEDKDARKAIRGIRKSLGEDAFQSIETLGPAARWAELLTRKEQEQ